AGPDLTRKGPSLTLPARTARAELTDLEAARGDDGRWIHRATVCLVRSDATNLRATWPTRVRLLAVELDGRSLPPSAGAADSVAIPLTGAAGICRLQFVWTGDGRDPPNAPMIPTLTADGQAVPPGP